MRKEKVTEAKSEIVANEMPDPETFRNRPEVQKLYHYISENDAREEALVLIKDKIKEKKQEQADLDN